MNTLNQLIEVGTVCEVQSGKALVKVNVLGRITPWLPVLMQASSFKRDFLPMHINEQVVVLAGRYVMGSIFNVDCKEPEGSSLTQDVIEYSDGTRIRYDVEKKEMNIEASGDIHVTCQNATVTAQQKVTVDASNIHLNKGTGVVTGAHICQFTGLPHSDCSSTVTAGK